MVWSREEMCKIAAAELQDGCFANLGVGMPTQVADYIDSNKHITLHSENGMLGVGPFPASMAEIDSDLINAGKQTVSELPGCCYFDSALSFAMLRGGHMDITILGAFQVSEQGDIANWMIPGGMINGMGGAMDIIVGIKRVVVLMKHTNSGAHKIVRKCSLPLTGLKVVNRIITDLCVFDIKDDGLHLVKKAEDVSVESLKEATEAAFSIPQEYR